MSNEYQVQLQREFPRTGVIRGRRLRMEGAVLGAGVPLLFAVVDYWQPGWAWIAILAAFGAINGAVVGWIAAPRAVSAKSLTLAAVGLGLAAALTGASVIALASSIVYLASGNLLAALLIGIAIVLVGVVVGSVLSIPAALVSVFILRRAAGDRRLANSIAVIFTVACLVGGGLVVLDLARNGTVRLTNTVGAHVDAGQARS